MRALYWQEIELTEYYFDSNGDKVQRYKNVRSDIRSDNELVDKVWLTQRLSENKQTLENCIEIIAGGKLKVVARFSKMITHKQAETLDIPEAIEWINNLKAEEYGK